MDKDTELELLALKQRVADLESFASDLYKGLMTILEITDDHTASFVQIIRIINSINERSEAKMEWLN